MKHRRTLGTVRRPYRTLAVGTLFEFTDLIDRPATAGETGPWQKITSRAYGKGGLRYYLATYHVNVIPYEPAQEVEGS